MNLLPIIQEFADKISSEKIEIYNEASVQHELVFLLRQRLPDYKVQLERNISWFGIENKDDEGFRKSEMDIVVFDSTKKEKHCIELKYPLSGQYPVQMFKACEVIKFLEQLVLSGFDKSYFVMLAEDNPFYNDEGETGIYKSFRKDKLINNVIVGTTGDVKDKRLCFKGNYKIHWKNLKDKLKYFVIEV